MTAYWTLLLACSQASDLPPTVLESRQGEALIVRSGAVQGLLFKPAEFQHATLYLVDDLSEQTQAMVKAGATGLTLAIEPEVDTDAARRYLRGIREDVPLLVQCERRYCPPSPTPAAEQSSSDVPPAQPGPDPQQDL